MDHGIWATWYDVLPSERDTYLTWLHKLYLPELSARDGYRWVAHYESVHGGGAMKIYEETLVRPSDKDVPVGTQFVMIVAGDSPHTFLNPSVFCESFELSEENRLMLGRQLNRRTCLFSEEKRIDGPAANGQSNGYIPGPALQFGSFCISSNDAEFALGKWYAQYRLPAMAKMPSCMTVRKLLSVAGWAKHAVMYEFESLEGRLNDFEIPHEAKGLEKDSWSHKIVSTTIHAPGSPMVARRIWPK